MSSQEQELLGKVFSSHNRREFLKRAGALSLSGTALAAFLDACSGSEGEARKRKRLELYAHKLAGIGAFPLLLPAL